MGTTLSRPRTGRPFVDGGQRPVGRHRQRSRARPGAGPVPGVWGGPGTVGLAASLAGVGWGVAGSAAARSTPASRPRGPSCGGEHGRIPIHEDSVRGPASWTAGPGDLGSGPATDAPGRRRRPASKHAGCRLISSGRCGRRPSAHRRRDRDPDHVRDRPADGSACRWRGCSVTRRGAGTGRGSTAVTWRPGVRRGCRW